MSKDPFEELFGPLADDAGDDANDAFNGSEPPTVPLPAPRAAGVTPGIRRGQGAQSTPPGPAPVVSTETTPMPARQRLAHEQAERVHTAQLPSTKRGAGASRGSGSKNTRNMPWVIVGAVAIVAIIVSIVVVNIARGTENAPEASPETNTTETTPQPETTPETPSTTPKPKPVEKPKKDEAPQVQVGPTNDLPIGPWSATSQLSQRLGSASFFIPDGVNLELTAELLNEFPESCKDMRTAWGATRLDDGTFQVRKPAETCADAPELYDTVWGLMAAWVGTIKAQ